MSSSQLLEVSLLRPAKNEKEAKAQLAGIVNEKIREGMNSIETVALGHHHIKPSFLHHDGTPMTTEEVLGLQCAHITSIGKLLGEEFLRQTPGPLLEQFSTVAGNQSIPDCGAMLYGLLNGFMVAFATKETESRALKAMLEIARIGHEANEIRGTSFGLGYES